MRCHSQRRVRVVPHPFATCSRSTLDLQRHTGSRVSVELPALSVTLSGFGTVGCGTRVNVTKQKRPDSKPSGLWRYEVNLTRQLTTSLSSRT